MDFKLPKRTENSNKSTYGKVLNIAGSDYMPGAAYLSSVSALKMGCGYCFLATTDETRRIVASQAKNIVFVPLQKIDKFINEADVVEIGCGLSKDCSGRNFYNKFLKYTHPNVTAIIDADALNLVSENPSVFIKKKLKKLIFTPHPMEAARLLECKLSDVLCDVENSAKFITNKYNCVTVLKTHRTFVCAPDGSTYTNTTGNNAMAKAGSGDVLTGMIAGLIAQGMDLFEGASLGVYLHGLCADIAKEKLTEYSVMAEDLISFIPDAVKGYLSINRI